MHRAVVLAGLFLAGSAPGAELLVAGEGNRAVLGFDAASGAFTRVFAQTISVGFSNPGGIALRPSDGALFVSSHANPGEIWRYTTATGAVVTPAVKTGLLSPNGIDFDATGASLYFADRKDGSSSTDDAVKRLDIATGAVTTIGSTTAAEFADVAVNGTDVFAVDTDGNRVVRFPAGPGGATVIGSGLSGPADLAFRSPTRLLVADTGSDSVLEYLNNGGTWGLDRVVLPASAGVQDPCALAIAPGGALTVAGCLSNDVVLVDLTTLAVTPFIAPGVGGLASPKDLAWNGSTLFVANPVANAVVYYDASGAPTGVRAQGITPALDGGIGISADETRVAVASTANDVVIEYAATTGGPLRKLASVCSTTFPSASDVAYGPGGDLFVACSGSSSVNRIDAATGAVSTFVASGSSSLFAPRSLSFGPNGNLFVTGATGELLQFNGASGSFVNAFVDAGGNTGGPTDPYGFRFTSGLLYVTSLFTDSVAVYSAATGAFVATRVASGSGGLDEPTGVAFASDGSLLIASHANDTVRRYDAGTGAYLGVFVPAGSHGLDAPIDLAVLPEPAAPVALAAGALLLALVRRGSRA
jgi:WD40 repeat protein